MATTVLILKHHPPFASSISPNNVAQQDEISPLTQDVQLPRSSEHGRERDQLKYR
jgi:hypothetical protein